MKFQNQQFLKQVAAANLDDLDNDEALTALAGRRAAPSFADKIQKIRTPEGKSIKAEQAAYKNRDSKRKFKN